MKSNRLIWTLVGLVVFATIAISVGTFDGHGQEIVVQKPVTAGTPIPSDNRDLSKYGAVLYDSPENLAANEERWSKNKRYDNQGWVFKTVSPPAGGIGKISHDPLPPAFPVEASTLILTGEVVALKTFLSNDMRGVYTEFVISPIEILKGSEKASSKTITADREGGVVIYPDGLRFLYQNSTLALPQLGGKYLFFLTTRGESQNYEIYTSYDIGGEQTYRLESDANLDESKQFTRLQLIEVVRNRIALSK